MIFQNLFSSAAIEIRDFVTFDHLVATEPIFWPLGAPLKYLPYKRATLKETDTPDDVSTFPLFRHVKHRPRQGDAERGKEKTSKM